MKRYLLLSICLLVFMLWAGSLRATSRVFESTAMTGSDCLACHGNSNLAKEVDGRIVSLFVDDKHFGGSVHGALDCAACHSDVKSVPHDPAPASVNCGACHADVHTAYSQGLHGKAVNDGNGRAAHCLDCHGKPHSILPSSDPRSPTNHANIAGTCGKCHGEKFIMEASGLTARPFLSYQESVHGRAVGAGNAKAAVCTDCHGVHDIRPPTDAQSSIFKFNVPKTCGQCHGDVFGEFTKSIHGQSVARGNSQAPVCTDCHGIHAIKPHIDPTSSVAAQALARTTCAKCHEGVRLSEEFGVPSKRISTYLDSYHGLASELGSNVVANCASCHGVHNILPSSDPASMIHPNNLVSTCGKCHPGASENFALSKVHLDVPVSQDIGSRATRWVQRIYLFLIFGTIGGMILHNVLVWRKKAIAKRHSEPRTVLRMNLNQRTQHWLLLSSFFVLVLSGFALKYPDSWVAWIMGSNEDIRRISHRIAAVVMLGVGLYHVGYMLMTAEGRQGVRDLFPKKKDLVDLIDNLRYYAFGKGSRAKFARFGYAEKAEYWAVVWGTIIMGVTGLMVWFKLEVFSFWPRWVIDVAVAIHFYEAILATLAIVVWHLYNVIFDPDVYPLNWALVDGRVSEHYHREEHPLDSATLERQQSNQIEDNKEQIE